MEPDLVREKLAYYDRDYRPAEIIEAARELEPSWATFAPLTYSSLPDFPEVLNALERELM